MIGRHDYGPSVSTNLDVSGTVLSSPVGTDASLLEPFKPQYPLSTLPDHVFYALTPSSHRHTLYLARRLYVTRVSHVSLMFFTPIYVRAYGSMHFLVYIG